MQNVFEVGLLFVRHSERTSELTGPSSYQTFVIKTLWNSCTSVKFRHKNYSTWLRLGLAWPHAKPHTFMLVVSGCHAHHDIFLHLSAPQNFISLESWACLDFTGILGMTWQNHPQTDDSYLWDETFSVGTCFGALALALYCFQSILSSMVMVMAAGSLNIKPNINPK